MKPRYWLPILLAFSIAPALQAAAPLQLRYTRPAERWTEALPVGNGRLGAMVFGGVTNEHLQLNEATLWSGGRRDWNNPGAKEILPQVRVATFAGDYQKAAELRRTMQGPYNQSYQPLGDLKLTFAGDKLSPTRTSAAWIWIAPWPRCATSRATRRSPAKSSAAFPTR